MTPALPREERDAIRARAEAATPGEWMASRDKDGPFIGVLDGFAWRQLIAVGSQYADAEFIAHARTDVLALLDVLDAAEEENERLRWLLGMVPPPFVTDPQTMDEARQKIGGLRGALASGLAERDAALAEASALRGRIEGLHRPDEHGPGRCDKADCITSCRECGDDWPCATFRALAADEGERTGA